MNIQQIINNSIGFKFNKTINFPFELTAQDKLQLNKLSVCGYTFELLDNSIVLFADHTNEINQAEDLIQQLLDCK